MKKPIRVHRAWRISPETDQAIKKWSKILGVSETQFVESTILTVSEGLAESATRVKSRVSASIASKSTQKEEKNTPTPSSKIIEKTIQKDTEEP